MKCRALIGHRELNQESLLLYFVRIWESYPRAKKILSHMKLDINLKHKLRKLVTEKLPMLFNEAFKYHVIYKTILWRSSKI